MLTWSCTHPTPQLADSGAKGHGFPQAPEPHSTWVGARCSGTRPGTAPSFLEGLSSWALNPDPAYRPPQGGGRALQAGGPSRSQAPLATRSSLPAAASPGSPSGLEFLKTAVGWLPPPAKTNTDVRGGAAPQGDTRDRPRTLRMGPPSQKDESLVQASVVSPLSLSALSLPLWYTASSCDPGRLEGWGLRPSRDQAARCDLF